MVWFNNSQMRIIKDGSAISIRKRISEIFWPFFARKSYHAHHISQTDQLLLCRKRGYGELTGLSKQIGERASDDHESFEKVKGFHLLRLDIGRWGRKRYHIVKGKRWPKISHLKVDAEPKKGVCYPSHSSGLSMATYPYSVSISVSDIYAVTC